MWAVVVYTNSLNVHVHTVTNYTDEEFEKAIKATFELYTGTVTIFDNPTLKIYQLHGEIAICVKETK